MLPVTSYAPPETRQAATPKHAVSVRAVTSKSVQENWLTISYSATSLEFQRTSTLCRVEKCSQDDLTVVFHRDDCLFGRLLVGRCHDVVVHFFRFLHPFR